MTITGVVVVLAALMLLLVRAGWVRPLAVVVCVGFGIALTMTPVGPELTHTLAEASSSVWAQLVNL